MNEELLKKARQTANLVAMSMKPNTDKNNQLVWSVAVVDTLIDDGSAMDLLDAIDANKPTNRFAYATTWLRNRLELEKQDFAQLLQRIEAQRLLRKAKQEDHA